MKTAAGDRGGRAKQPGTLQVLTWVQHGSRGIFIAECSISRPESRRGRNMVFRGVPSQILAAVRLLKPVRPILMAHGTRADICSRVQGATCVGVRNANAQTRGGTTSRLDGPQTGKRGERDRGSTNDDDGMVGNGVACRSKPGDRQGDHGSAGVACGGQAPSRLTDWLRISMDSLAGNRPVRSVYGGTGPVKVSITSQRATSVGRWFVRGSRRLVHSFVHLRRR